MKKESELSIFLCGLCAMLYLLRGIQAIVDREYKKSVPQFVMTLLCPALWIATFVLKLLRCASDEEE